MRIALVGGTGPAGVGLAERFAAAGHQVLIGSRTAEKGAKIRDKVLEVVPDGEVEATSNQTAVSLADVVFITVPFDAYHMTVAGLSSHLQGKIVVAIANPIRVADRRATVEASQAGSLAEDVAAMAPGARVVGALHEIRVSNFSDFSHKLDADTIVTGDDDEAKRIVMELVEEIPGLRAIDGGPLSNSRYVEGFVAVLITINFRYKTGSSYRITGV